MAKRQSISYVCSNCGQTSNVWSGKCMQCGEWNTLIEQLPLAVVAGRVASGDKLKALSISESIQSDQQRIKVGMSEVDNVFGGGIVAGSVTLMAGQPGIGKSTLLLQMANEISKNVPVLYISGEESIHQIGMRAKRLNATQPTLQLAASGIADDIAASITSGDYRLVIVDSIQTITSSAILSSAGSVSQISGSTQLLTLAAKQSETAVILVGHVTKEGAIAGPKVLEHVVDVVLQLEGDRYGGFKILRSVKNRYGSTNESAIFEMEDQGLKQVANPSATLLAERRPGDGSVVLATIEGTRPLLVEVQALVNPTSFGYPKRTASGFDLNRLNLLVAVLERRTKLRLADQDIFVNVVGGIQLREPAADLAVCLAIGSAAKEMQLKHNAVVFGEIGLNGEIRHVQAVEKRIAEAKKLGFDGGIGPIQSKQAQLPDLFGVGDLKSALNQFLSKG